MGCGTDIPIPVRIFYFMNNRFFYIDENNLIKATNVCWWLSQESIEIIIESCNHTLKYYKNNKYTDYDITSLNHQIWDEEFSKNNCRKTAKIKTYVYIMIDHNTKYYKIGRSDTPLRREKTLQSEKPTIELIYKFECEYGIEKELHNKFYNKKIRGEWFNLDDNDIDYIKKNYK